jgi:NAD+ kinase
VIEIEVIGHAPATLAVDGQPAATLVEGDTVRCTPSDATARFVRFGDHRYHQILKAKFGLTDR